MVDFLFSFFLLFFVVFKFYDLFILVSISHEFGFLFVFFSNEL